MTYITTKKQCQKSIDESELVCHYCGGDRSPIETVDNAGNPTYWEGCLDCNIFAYGAPEKHYKIALELFENHNFRPYSFDEEPEDKSSSEYDYFKRSNVGGIVSMVRSFYMAEKKVKELK